MKFKKIAVTISFVATMSLALVTPVFAANSDIYLLSNTSTAAYTKADTAHATIQRTIGLNSQNYGYEYNGEIYKFDDISTLFNNDGKNFTQTMADLPTAEIPVAKVGQANTVIHPTSLSISKTSDIMTVGNTDTLTSTVSPSNATNQAVTWTSSDNAVATVDATGKLTAIAPGTVTITATTDGNKTASCAVTVNDSIAPIGNEQAQATEKANVILATIIKPGMSEMDKELAINDYIVANTNYDVVAFDNNNIPSDDYTAYGILIKHIGVCEGYADAFKLLCDIEVIPCQVVDDPILNHAWNIVQLDDGNYYQVDCTWDDPVASDGKSSGNNMDHRYFNISDKQMFVNHTIDSQQWVASGYPKCNVDNSEFYSNAGVDLASNGNVIYANISGKLSKVDSNGNITVISNDSAKNINYYNGYIYYINNGCIYGINPDGQNHIQVLSGNISSMYLYNGALYYLNPSDWTIHKLVLDGIYNDNKSITSTTYSNYLINNGCLYYMAGQFTLHSLDLSNMVDKEILNVDSKDIYNQNKYNNYGVLGNYIYYGIENSMYRMDLNGNNNQLLSNNVSNAYNEIQIFDNYIYYNSINDGNWYKMDFDGTAVTKLSF